MSQLLQNLIGGGGGVFTSSHHTILNAPYLQNHSCSTKLLLWDSPKLTVLAHFNSDITGWLATCQQCITKLPFMPLSLKYITLPN